MNRPDPESKTGTLLIRLSSWFSTFPALSCLEGSTESGNGCRLRVLMLKSKSDFAIAGLSSCPNFRPNKQICKTATAKTTPKLRSTNEYPIKSYSGFSKVYLWQSDIP